MAHPLILRRSSAQRADGWDWVVAHSECAPRGAAPIGCKGTGCYATDVAGASLWAFVLQLPSMSAPPYARVGRVRRMRPRPQNFRHGSMPAPGRAVNPFFKNLTERASATRALSRQRESSPSGGGQAPRIGVRPQSRRPAQLNPNAKNPARRRAGRGPIKFASSSQPKIYSAPPTLAS